ncbi:MAG: YqaE/Pmp3 family membrane protein [Nonlabens sp.]|uniref:YqaE/Pmp3 family membrane protein n=1 Tax=Nonlabens sp. TaxID=1888209 RepID=UPI00321BB2A5
MKPLTIFLNLFLPPISVFRKRGIHNDLAINIILTILFFSQEFFMHFILLQNEIRFYN